jgi:DNA-binding FadR family transcriptional regulator
MLERSLADHRRIYEAVKRRDPKRAVSEMSRHMANIRDAMERFYRTSQPAAPKPTAGLSRARTPAPRPE